MGPEEDGAFSQYVTARRDHVRRTAYLLCGDWHRADDLTQIAFVKLYGAWERIRDHRALDAYVRSCLVRATVDESRRPWRRERAVEVLPETVDTFDIASVISDRELVQSALEQVPSGQRAVLVLRYFEGLDVAESASALGCSEGNVKSQTARGLAALKKALQAMGELGTPRDRGGPTDGKGRR
ncbi:RNA polymerase sigma-70 factor (sigma-E family) [Nakamurella sp. UYEF19]|uniref:SigE family RNA polymerase sigma factor n=1 Tax=Nakamurella sp. UYEF19 TaxID=1756392 RepID=UPI00339AA546